MENSTDDLFTAGVRKISDSYGLPSFVSEEQLSRIQAVEARSDDIWVYTYPRSGTHLTMVIVRSLLNIPMKDFQIIHWLEMIVDEIEDWKSPRIIATHLQMSVAPTSMFKDQVKVICVVRNPKDTAVSFFHAAQQNPTAKFSGSFHQFLELYMKGQVPFGSWFDFYFQVWKEHMNSRNVLFLSYEDILQETQCAISKVANFLGVDPGPACVQKVQQEITFVAMKTKYDPLDATFLGDGVSLYRKGIVGDWKNHFTVDESETFDVMYEERMKDYPDLKQLVRFE